MIKIALLMGGEFRSFESCFTNWKKHLFNNNEYDLFLSTWSTTNNLSDKFSDVVQTDVTKERVMSVLDKEPKFLNIEKEIDFGARYNKQIYHWLRLITSLINYKDDYDVAILTRPDMLLRNYLGMNTWLKTYDKNKVYGASEISLNGPDSVFPLTVHDIYFISDPRKLIDSFIGLPMVKYNPTLAMAGKTPSMHDWLADHFFKNGIYIHRYEPGGLIDSTWKHKGL